MAVVTSALNDGLDGLVTTLRAATGFRSPSEAGTDIPVFDGGIYGAGSNFSAVVIGHDGSDNPVQRPIRFATDWHDMDLTTDENATIQCAVVVWSGDANPDTIADQRGTIADILSDFDTAVRASNTAAALGVDRLLWSKIDSGELIQTATAEGTESRLPFTFTYRALLQVT